MDGKEVKDYSVAEGTTLSDLSRQYLDSGGFVAKKVGTAVEIMEKMLSEKDCIRILSFPAAIISTGTRGIIKEVVKRKMFDIVMTTCGTLDHDFARSYKPYHHGSFEADDRELHKKGVNRLGNIFIPNASYGEIIEEKLQPMLKDIHGSGKRNMSTHEFVWELGNRMDNEDSIIYWCARNKIPMIIPGITDGAFGLQLMIFMQQNRDFIVDVFKDEFFLSSKLFRDGIKTGALMIGGGISKHHVIWWNQFKGGLDYAVYITTAPEWDGSLSGARIKEGISWGKVSESAKFQTVEGDATVLLPLILGKFL